MASENVVIKILRSLVISTDQADFRSLIKDYRAEAGEAIPYRQLGYANLEDFLRASGEFNLCETANGIRVTAKTSQESAHIADLRRNQTVSKTDRRRRNNAPTRSAQFNRLPPRMQPPVQHNDGLAQQKIMVLTRQLQSLQQAQQIQQMQHFQQIKQLQAANELQQRKTEVELRQMKAIQEEKQKYTILVMQANQDLRDKQAKEEIQRLKAIQEVHQITAMQAMQEVENLKRHHFEKLNQSYQLIANAERNAKLQQQSLINQRMNIIDITKTTNDPSPLKQKPMDNQISAVVVNKNELDSENTAFQQSPSTPIKNNAIEKLLNKVSKLNLGETSPKVGEMETNLSSTEVKVATPERVNTETKPTEITKIVEHSAAKCKNPQISNILAMRAKQVLDKLPNNITQQRKPTAAERQELKGVKISVNNRLVQIKSAAQFNEPKPASTATEGTPTIPFETIPNMRLMSAAISSDAKHSNDSTDGHLKTPYDMSTRRKVSAVPPRPLKQTQTISRDSVDVSSALSKECENAAREVNEMVCMAILFYTEIC